MNGARAVEVRAPPPRHPIRSSLAPECCCTARRLRPGFFSAVRGRDSRRVARVAVEYNTLPSLSPLTSVRAFFFAASSLTRFQGYGQGHAASPSTAASAVPVAFVRPFLLHLLSFLLFLCAFHCVLLLFSLTNRCFLIARRTQHQNVCSSMRPRIPARIRISEVRCKMVRRDTSRRRDGDSTEGRWLAVRDEEQLLHPVSREEGLACLCWLFLRLDARTPLSFQLRKSYAGLACQKYAPFLRDKSSSLASTHRRVSSFSYTRRADVCCLR